MKTQPKPKSTPEQLELIFKFNQKAFCLANKISHTILTPAVKMSRLYNRSLPKYIHEV